MYEDLVTCSIPEQTQLTKREIVWLEAYKANILAGTRSDHSEYAADDALKHYDNLFNGAK